MRKGYVSADDALCLHTCSIGGWPLSNLGEQNGEVDACTSERDVVGIYGVDLIGVCDRNDREIVRWIVHANYFSRLRFLHSEYKEFRRT